MKPLVVIPARGGSKRLPGKNIKPLNGKPLIHYSIEAAREVFEDAVICVSTDDEQIKEVSEQTGLTVPFLRPASLATDSADTRSVLLHAYEYYKKDLQYEADVIILLQPTSPLRAARHIKEALKLYNDELDMVVSVKETDANPYFVLYEENEEGYLEKSKKGEFTRKQDCPKVWEFNGAIYVINSNSIQQGQYLNSKRIIKYEMTKKSSIDIDDVLDWKLTELVLNES
ncbi:MAG: CMP-N-acetylneuraminic acid synthetase [Balneola sp.]|nr:CMP-N-acetylneuraminic acid synthetase [Balneola sp.]|tara:strand:- start:49245 stop:49928 length:684 start_codon:yes stop_codon:yes gene_type:complete